MEEPVAGDLADALAVKDAFEHAKAGLALSCGARVSLHVLRSGHVAQSIWQYAAEHGFDLIALGRHGESGLLPHRLGHVAQSAASTSQIPLLLLSSQ